MNEKQYQYKVFGQSGDFILTEIINDFSFSSQINGGQGELSIDINLPYSSTLINHCDFIQVSIFDQNYISGKVLYTGFVSKIKRMSLEGKQYLNITVLPLVSLLNLFYFYNGATYGFNLNQEPAQTLKDIIDFVNTKISGGWLSYGINVINYGTNISIDFSYNKNLDALKKVVDTTGFWWHIGASGELFFRSTSVNSHKLSLEEEIQELIIIENNEKIVNDHFLAWQSGTKITSDTGSQSTYFLRQLRESKSEIVNLASATEYGNNYITNNKDLSYISSLIVNSKYNYEDIQPGDTITIQNIDLNIINDRRVKKIEYNKKFLKIDLDDYNSLGKEIFTS